VREVFRKTNARSVNITTKTTVGTLLLLIYKNTPLSFLLCLRK